MYIYHNIILLLAERVSSLGKDWHRGCLKCTKCKKTLTPGGHAQVINKYIDITSITFYCKEAINLLSMLCHYCIDHV